jgi:hypothetical protein
MGFEAVGLGGGDEAHEGGGVPEQGKGGFTGRLRPDVGLRSSNRTFERRT